MSRDITIDAMIALPRLNRFSATALAEQLLTTAAAEKGSGLPLFIERPRSRLFIATEALKAQILPKEAMDTDRAKEADRTLDNAWRSFSSWLGSLASLPDGTFADLPKVRALHRLLFDNGLSFVVLAFREEWTQSEMRIKAASEGGFEPMIEQLGGLPLYNHLKNAHARYGEVLGINAKLQTEESPLVRVHLLNLISAIKAYAVKAAAWADPDDPDSELLSQALLSPLITWKDTPRASRSTDEAEPEAEAAV